MTRHESPAGISSAVVVAPDAVEISVAWPRQRVARYAIRRMKGPIGIFNGDRAFNDDLARHPYWYRLVLETAARKLKEADARKRQ